MKNQGNSRNLHDILRTWSLIMKFNSIENRVKASEVKKRPVNKTIHKLGSSNKPCPQILLWKILSNSKLLILKQEKRLGGADLVLLRLPDTKKLVSFSLWRS